MRFLLCIFFAVTMSAGHAGCTQVLDGMIAGLFNSDDDDGPTIRPNDRQIRNDESRLARGEPMRYHRDEQELRRHQRDVEAARQQRRRNQ